MKLAAALLLTLAAVAQEAPEIRGTVVEDGLNIPLPGAEVKILQVAATGNPPELTLVSTGYTDGRGAFSFKPTQLASYNLEIRKDGYQSSQTGSELLRQRVTLTAAKPRADIAPMALFRPGSLTGRILDEERNPLEGIHVFVQVAAAASLRPVGPMAETDEAGNFTVSGLRPGPFVVRIAPEDVSKLTLLADSEEEFKTVDSDIESSFWPGAVADPKSVVPIKVQPGPSTTAGTITLRTTPYYRARVEFKGDCTPGEEWRMVLFTLPYTGRGEQNRMATTPCRNRFLIRDLAPGSYGLYVWTGKATIRWAETSFVVSTRNVETSIGFSPSADLTARVIVPSGVAPVSSNNLQIEIAPEDAPPAGGTTTFRRDSQGQFAIRNVVWSRHSLHISGLPGTHYVKEIRYAGQPVPDNVLTISPGGQVDIVVDDHPATITGTVKGDRLPPMTMILLERQSSLGPSHFGNEPFYSRTIAIGGSFSFSGLAPGEYRLRAGPMFAANDLNTEGGTLVRVAAGETKTVEVEAEPR